MGGIWQGDVIVKMAIDLGIDEMRKNPWLLDHAFESLKVISYISDKYGQKNIDAAKEWFANNKIDVYMRPRNDKDILPCVTITPGNTPEKSDMKHMADMSTVKKILMPTEIGKPIPFVVKPFTPTGYDPSTGEVGVDENTPGLDAVIAGMILVNPANSMGYVIKDIVDGAIIIEDDLQIEASQFAVIPQFAYYEARVEHTFFQDSYNIGCQAHGDPQTLIWLHTIVLYAILRYRESLLEGTGFTESSVSSGEIIEDPNYEGPGGEQAFIRMINLTGQVENSWIKAPRRFIENVLIKKQECDEITGGIKILSNFDAPSIVDKKEESWYTIKGKKSNKKSSKKHRDDHEDDFEDE